MATLRDLFVASDEDLVLQALSGDDRAVDALLARYRLFVRRKAQTYFVPGGDTDDVIQEGMIGLYKAVLRFDPSRGRFSAFADLCVTNQIHTAIASARRKGNLVLNSSARLDIGWLATEGEDTASEISAGDDPADEIIWRQERNDLARFVRATLSPFERDVLGRHLAGHTYAAIAEALGRQPKAVDNALQRIRRKVATFYLEGAAEG